MNHRSPITSHVLDLKKGKPGVGIPVVIEIESGGRWKQLAAAKTDKDGRVESLFLPGTKLKKGNYRLSFDLQKYLKAGFYPRAQIVFRIQSPKQHYHIPLLLSPFGFSTYRGT